MIKTSQKATLTAQWVVLSAGLGADGVEYGKQWSFGVTEAMLNEVVTLYRTFQAAFATEHASFPNESLWYWSMSDDTQVVTLVRRKQQVGRVALHYMSLLFSNDDFESRIGTPYLPYNEGWHRDIFQESRNIDRREIEITLPQKTKKGGRTVNFAEGRGDNDYSEEAVKAWRERCANLVKEGERIPYFAEWWPNKERTTGCFTTTFRPVVEGKWTLDTALSKAREACRKLESLLPGDRLIEEANLLINSIQGLGNGVDRLSKTEWQSSLDTASENAGHIEAGLSPNSSGDTHIRALQTDYQAFKEAVRHVRQPGTGTKQRASDIENRAWLKIPRLAIPPLAKIALVLVALLTFTGVRKWQNRQGGVPPLVRPSQDPKPSANKKADFNFLNEVTKDCNLLGKVKHGNLGLPEFVKEKRKEKSFREIVNGDDGILREHMKHKLLLEGLFKYIETNCLKGKEDDKLTLDTLYKTMNAFSGTWTEKYKFIREECGKDKQDGFNALLNGCIGSIKEEMNRNPVIDPGGEDDKPPKPPNPDKAGKKTPKPPRLPKQDTTKADGSRG